MKLTLLSCLSSFLKAANFQGKRQFIREVDGLDRLSAWICVKGEDEEAKYGVGLERLKIRLKLLQLLYDFT